METICATGICVSEVKYITVEAAWCGKAEISLKGKIRTIMLPGKLCRKLLKYTRKQKIVFGEMFLTGSARRKGRKKPGLSKIFLLAALVFVHKNLSKPKITY